MRSVLISMLVLLAAGAAEAGPMAKQAEPDFAPWRRTLFVSPMGEPFRATDPAQRGIDLWLAGADADHDGKLSRDEYLADALRFFRRLDANADDSATSSESTTLLEREAPEVLGVLDNRPPLMSTPGATDTHQPRRRDGDVTVYQQPQGTRIRPNYGRGGSVMENRQGAGRFGLLAEIEPVMTCDRDFDRRVSRDEFTACAARRFAQIDVNSDGFFTADEAAARN